MKHFPPEPMIRPPGNLMIKIIGLKLVLLKFQPSKYSDVSNFFLEIPIFTEANRYMIVWTQNVPICSLFGLKQLFY